MVWVFAKERWHNLKSYLTQISIILAITQICFVSIGFLGYELLPKKFKSTATIDTYVGQEHVMRSVDHYLSGLEKPHEAAFLFGLEYRVLRDKAHLGLIKFEGFGSAPSVVENGMFKQIDRLKQIVKRERILENDRKLRLCEQITRMCTNSGFPPNAQQNRQLEATISKYSEAERSGSFEVLTITKPRVTGIHSFPSTSVYLFFSLIGVFFGCLISWHLPSKKS